MKVTVFILTILLLLNSCQRDTDQPVVSLGSGGVTVSQLTGNYGLCHIIGSGEFGTAVDGMSFYRSLSFLSDSSFQLNVSLYTGTNCQVGGTELFHYSQGGSFATGGIMSSPSGATQIIFNVTSSLLTVNGGTSGANNTWGQYLHDNCPGGPNFSVTSPSTGSVSAVHCYKTSSPDFLFPTFTANRSIFYDAFFLSGGAPATLTTSPIVSIFESGIGSNFPVSATLIYTQY